MVERHGELSLLANSSNSTYRTQVMEKAKRLRWLLEGGSGIVEGVVGSSLEEAKPIAEAAFGEEISVYSIEKFDDFSLTEFPGLLGRIRRIGDCRTEGPLIALDFLGAGD